MAWTCRLPRCHRILPVAAILSHVAVTGAIAQDLRPGEFVFGYPGQDPNAKDITMAGPNSLTEGGPHGAPAGPVWAKDGAYLVIRRLRQDVAKFRQFLVHQAGEASHVHIRFALNRR